MRYRRLGHSDLEVSEIGLGSWLTFAGGVEADRAKACTTAALDAGVTFLDTAEVYGNGAAESTWGEILSAFPRDSYVLATKVWGSEKPPAQGQTPGYIATAIDASLRRLRTDHVDLYQVHRFDPRVPIEDTVEALTAIVDAGKARYLGFSEWTPEQIQAAVDLARPGLFVSSQPQYSILWRAPESAVFPLCEAHGISQVVWSPLAQGLLTGKYVPGQAHPAGSRFADDAMNVSMQLVANDDTIAAAQRLQPVAAAAGLSMPELALAWVLRRHEVASAITGASRPEQVVANAGASGTELTDDVLAAVDDAVRDVAVVEPVLAVFAQPGVLHRSR